MMTRETVMRFTDACDLKGFCPAQYTSETMCKRWCKDGCSVMCGPLFKEAHPKIMEKLADKQVIYVEYIKVEE